jgi:ATP-dependent 26S proteasome regulatory subunit
MPFRDTILEYVKAHYPALFITTHEEHRVEQEIVAAAKANGQPREVWRWSVSLGWVNEEGKVAQTTDPAQAIGQIPSLPEGSLCVIRDFAPYFTDPVCVRKVRDILPGCKGTGRVLIFLSPAFVLPVDLTKDVTLLEFTLPTREEIGVILDGLIEAQENTNLTPTAQYRHAILNAAAGLTASEAENAFALALVRHKTLNCVEAIRTIQMEKGQTIKKSGILEYMQEWHEDLSNVGGMEGLKRFLEERAGDFSPDARKEGIPAPKGILAFGIQGCGKSLLMKCLANAWKLPLVKLDCGRIFGSLVGESEQHAREALAQAEAMAPCVLLIDEINHGLAGTEASGQTDGGTGSRVFGTILNWMQERAGLGVYVGATANNISKLPGALLRPGRFDKLFFVDLPNEQERLEILSIHLAKRRKQLSKKDSLMATVRSTAGFSGAELEQAVIDAIRTAYRETRAVSAADIEHAASDITPLSQTSKDEIEAIRTWARGRAVCASDVKSAEMKGRKLQLN